MWSRRIKHGLLALLLVLLPMPSWAAIAFVQAKICSNASTASGTFTCTFDSDTTAGNVIVGITGYITGTVTVITFTDNQSGVYSTKQTAIGSPLPASSGGAIGVGTVGTAGATTVTATYTNSELPDYHGLCILEYSGVNNTTTTDVSAKFGQLTPTTTTDAVTSGAATTTFNNDMIVGGFWDLGAVTGIYTAGTGFTQRATIATGTNLRGMCEDLAQGTLGSIAATSTINNANDDTYSFMVALRQAAGGVPSGLTLLGVGN